MQYWNSWALGQFGDAAVAAAAAAIFVEKDSYNLPRPVSWIGGPGGFSPTVGPGCVTLPFTYQWVDRLVAQRVPLLAAIAAARATLDHLERFDYWAGQFVYMRSVALFECCWGSYISVIDAVNKITDPVQVHHFYPHLRHPNSD